MSTNLHLSADLLTLTNEIFRGKFHFLCRDAKYNGFEFVFLTPNTFTNIAIGFGVVKFRLTEPGFAWHVHFRSL